MKYSHFTNFGVSAQPEEADTTGYLAYREGYETLPRSQWTQSEIWIDDQEHRIAEWRKRK